MELQSQMMKEAACRLLNRGFTDEELSFASLKYAPILPLYCPRGRPQVVECGPDFDSNIDSEIERIRPSDPDAAEALKTLHKEMNDIYSLYMADQ